MRQSVQAQARLRSMIFSTKFLCLLIASAGAVSASEVTPAQRDPFKPAQRKYWAFQPVKRSPVPQVASKEWGRNPIDAFIARRLEEKGITPSKEAPRVTLLRRAYFDLVGLPPTVDEVNAFLADQSPNAYEKVVDKLLASPQYGERWARHWLDLARYAESDGFRADDVRQNAWRYRDYVIRSFNEDKPYDRFVQEQIAGDELWPDNLEARIATAFNRNYPDEYNAQNLRQRRQQILDDMTDTVGAVFLGMTFECARCHDHKFDPILQADYYKLQAFFSNTSADDEFPMLSKQELEAHHAKRAVWEQKTADIRKAMSELLNEAREKSRKSRYMAYVDEVQQALDKPLSARTPIELWMADKAKYFMNPTDESLAGGLKGEAKEKYQKLADQLAAFKDLDPGPLPKGTGLTELTKTPIPTHILSAGAFNRPLDEVQPGFMTILDSKPAQIVNSAHGTSTGRRTALAKWLASPENPLTPRVMVNRLWHHHFGRGIVPTPSDFGVMGERRTHPELLEWLAAEFVSSGWSLKHMHRLIMTSSAYRQSSDFRAAAAGKDPANRLFWRFERRRLESEAIRDTALHVSGLLNTKMYGPSVRPPLPAGVPDGPWKTSPEVADQRRRSIYTFIRRNNLYPMLDMFDLPDTHLSCGRRGSTTTALQALTYLNSEPSIDWARAFAGRVFAEAGADRSKQVEAAWRLAYSRVPSGPEKDTALTFLQQHKTVIMQRAEHGAKLAIPDNRPGSVEPAEAGALVDFCHALMNSSEFVYIN